MRAPEIWLLRHAQSEWNAAGRWQGHGNPPLSEAGRAQALEAAQCIAPELANREPFRVYSSDLERAVETARAVCGPLGVEPVALTGLRELDVGRWTGLRRAEIEARDPQGLAAFEGGQPDVRPGGGESRREIRSRVRRVVSELVAADPESTLLLVVHLGVVRALVPGTEPDHVELTRTDLARIEAAASAR
jgi:broad specificity phosphatase PhoE